MEGLLVDRVDRHLRCAEYTRIIKRADLEDDQRQTRPSRCQMGPAFAAKLARHHAFKIGTRELARFTVVPQRCARMDISCSNCLRVAFIGILRWIRFCAKNNLPTWQPSQVDALLRAEKISPASRNIVESISRSIRRRC